MSLLDYLSRKRRRGECVGKSYETYHLETTGENAYCLLALNNLRHWDKRFKYACKI